MRKINRREFTRGVGAGLLLSPFLSLLNPRPLRAAAAPAKQAKRLLLFCSMGTNPAIWSPTNVTGESAFTYTKATAPLGAANVSDSVILVEGLPSGNPGDGHGSPDGLTGMGNGYYAVNNVVQKLISVDQFVADSLIKAGVNTPIASLLLGAETSNTGKPMFYRAGNPLLPIASPLSAFNTAFGGALPMGVAPNTVLKRRQSILDAVTGEINNIYANVGAADKAKLDLHLDSIRSLENKLTQSATSTTSSGSCNQMPKPTDSTASAPAIADNLLHLQIMVNALACDVTRVAAIEFGTDQMLQVDLPSLQGDQHGGFIHGNDPGFQDLISFENWLATQFAGLITSLKARPEPTDPTGTLTLFDTTLLVWARDMGDAVVHNQNSMRFVLAGGAGGYLKGNAAGRYLDLRAMGTTGTANRHERVLLNVCQAMGITDYTGFGDPGLSMKTPLPNIAA
jgi:hypothetical protein